MGESGFPRSGDQMDWIPRQSDFEKENYESAIDFAERMVDQCMEAAQYARLVGDGATLRGWVVAAAQWQMCERFDVIDSAINGLEVELSLYHRREGT